MQEKIPGNKKYPDVPSLRNRQQDVEAMTPEEKKRIYWGLSLIVIAIISIFFAIYSLGKYSELVNYVNHIETAAQRMQDADGNKTCFYRINLVKGTYNIMCLNQEGKLSIGTIGG